MNIKADEGKEWSFGSLVDIIEEQIIKDAFTEAVAKMAAKYICDGIASHPGGVDGFIADMDKEDNKGATA